MGKLLILALFFGSCASETCESIVRQAADFCPDMGFDLSICDVEMCRAERDALLECMQDIYDGTWDAIFNTPDEPPGYTNCCGCCRNPWNVFYECLGTV